MQNLLQSLSAQRLKVRAPEGDLKRLLTTVKENRVRTGITPSLDAITYTRLLARGMIQSFRMLFMIPWRAFCMTFGL